MHEAEEQHSKRGMLDRLALANAIHQKAARKAAWEPEDKQQKPSGLLGFGDEPIHASGGAGKPAQHGSQALGLATPPQGAEEAVSSASIPRLSLFRLCNISTQGTPPCIWERYQ